MRRTDQIILENLRSGLIRVDVDKGIIYGIQKKPLKGTNHNGYLSVGLRHVDGNGQRKTVKVYVHRVVWLAKYGVIPDGKTVTHVRPPDSDNRLNNLSIGRKCGYKIKFITPAQVRRIRSYKRLTQRQIADRLGISQGYVSMVRRKVA